jgi:hypothetical protein
VKVKARADVVTRLRLTGERKVLKAAVVGQSCRRVLCKQREACRVCSEGSAIYCGFRWVSFG